MPVPSAKGHAVRLCRCGQTFRNGGSGLAVREVLVGEGAGQARPVTWQGDPARESLQGAEAFAAPLLPLHRNPAYPRGARSPGWLLTGVCCAAVTPACSQPGNGGACPSLKASACNSGESKVPPGSNKNHLLDSYGGNLPKDRTWPTRTVLDDFPRSLEKYVWSQRPVWAWKGDGRARNSFSREF